MILRQLDKRKVQKKILETTRKSLLQFLNHYLLTVTMSEFQLFRDFYDLTKQ